MSRDYSFLKSATPHQIVNAVRTEGMLALCHNGLTEFENAEAASKAIMHLYCKNIILSMMFASDLSSDDSYRRIYFRANMESTTILATIERVVEYRQFGEEKYPDKVELGPCVHKDNAQAFVDMLNSLDWGTNSGARFDKHE